MATLPSREDFARVTPSNQRGVVTTSRPAGLEQEAGARLGAQVAQIGEQLKTRVEQDEATEAYNQYRKAELELTKGDQGFLTVQGGNAVKEGAFDSYREKRKQLVDSLATNLSGGAQKLFRSAAQKSEIGFEEGIANHKLRESERYRGEVRQGTIDTEIDMAANSWADDKAVATSGAAIKQTFQRARDVDGMAPELAEARKNDALSKMHFGVISGALNAGDVTKAKDHLTKYDQEITDPRIRTNLREGIIRVEKEAKAQTAYSMIADLPEAEALKKISGISDKDIRNEVKSRYNDRQEALRAEEDAIMNPTRTLLGDANSAGRVIGEAEKNGVLSGLRTVNPKAYDKASKEIYAHNEKIRTDRDQARKRAEESSSGGSAAVWYSLKTDPNALRVTNLLEIKSKGLLSEKHFNNLVEEQQALRSKPNKEQTILEDKSAVDMVLKGAGIKTGTNGDPAKLGPFYERFDAKVRQEGENVPQKRKIELARELVQEVAIERSLWFDTSKKAFELNETDNFSVPADKKKEISAFLKLNGLPANDENIRTLYLESLK
jgi:hypothetical protein